MNEDPLFKARVRIAKYSLDKAAKRIALQKKQYMQKSEIENEEIFDQGASEYSIFHNLCT